MANPQKENGFVPIANEILEALAKTSGLGFSNGQVLWAILRKTYGFHKKKDKISIQQLQNMTGCSRRTIIYTLQNLEAKKIIAINRNKTDKNENEPNEISFNKNYDEWVVQEKSTQYDKALNKRKEYYHKKKKGVVQEKRGSARNRKKVVQETENKHEFLAPTKDIYTKDILLQKKKEYVQKFDEFYSLYPKKKSKKIAFKAWDKLKMTDELFNKIMTALKLDIESKEWNKDGGQFIPLPATWLNQERWEDSHEKIVTQKEKEMAEHEAFMSKYRKGPQYEN